MAASLEVNQPPTAVWRMALRIRMEAGLRTTPPPFKKLQDGDIDCSDETMKELVICLDSHAKIQNATSHLKMIDSIIF